MASRLACGLAMMTSLAAASCAAIWDFQDATDPDGGDGGSGETRRLSADAMAEPDARRDVASTDAHVSKTKPPDVDAAAADAKRDHGASEHEDASAADAKPPSEDHETPDTGAPAPTCEPGCGPGSTCAVAVGNIAVCVDTTCTDSNDCPGSNCCVWLDRDSAQGKCQAPGPPSAASCLCVDTSPGWMGKGMCKTCAAPTSDPTASVQVCKSS